MNNVTPIRSGNEQPPSGPAKPKTPRKRHQKVGLGFAADGNATAFRAFTGLKGVCHALEALEGHTEDLNDFARLSIAASMLVDMLEELQL